MIFEQSGTKIKFQLHCIMPIAYEDKAGLNLKDLLDEYNKEGKIDRYYTSG